MFRPIRTILKEPKLSLAKVTLKRRLPEEGPDGPKHVAANIEIF